MFNKKIITIIGLLLFHNTINTFPSAIRMECDPRNVTALTPEQWYFYRFKEIKHSNEKKIIINLLRSIVKKFESAKEIVHKQISLIEQGANIPNALQIVDDAVSFNIPFPPEFSHLTPILLDLLKTIMPLSHYNFPDDEVDPNDKEMVIAFVNKYALGIIDIVSEKGNECLSYIEKEEK